MAKKARTVWVCQECGNESPKWVGRCICGAWGTLVEEKIVDTPENDSRSRHKVGSSTKGASSRPVQLIKVGSADRERLNTGIGELDRVLGGGLVKGSLTLISGEPGIGKSTLLIQTAVNMAKSCGNVLYVSGEESSEQIKMRADRVCEEIPEALFVMAETNMDNVEAACESIKPAFLIIDSIQTMYIPELDSAPGSVSQVRACGNVLMKLGKSDNIPIFIVAHVTKSGDLAGPKIVEHLVDCVLNFTGERDREIRILRVFKNRFGTTSEIGAFSMEAEGLLEIENLSGSLLEETEKQAEGSIVTAVYEGSRPVLMEIQALTAGAVNGFGRRTAVGADYQRLNMILAVLEKKAGINLGNKDVYVNIVGGIKAESTSVDLGIALAVYSSLREILSPKACVAIGEVGLTGNISSVQNAERIAQEAIRLGYNLIIMPSGNADKIKREGGITGGRIVGVRNIREAVQAFKEG